MSVAEREKQPKIASAIVALLVRLVMRTFVPTCDFDVTLIGFIYYVISTAKSDGARERPAPVLQTMRKKAQQSRHLSNKS